MRRSLVAAQWPRSRSPLRGRGASRGRGVLVPGPLARRASASARPAATCARALGTSTASAAAARRRRGTSPTSRSRGTVSRSSSRDGRVSAVYTLWQPDGLARAERPPARRVERAGAPLAGPLVPVACSSYDALVARLGGTRARRTTSSTAGSGASGSSARTRIPADDRARQTSRRPRSGSTASPTARRSSPRARSTSGPARAST